MPLSAWWKFSIIKPMIKKRIREDVQFLRGLAVLIIFLFHFDQNIFRFFYIGVDIFFILSGYVITNSIFKNKVVLLNTKCKVIMIDMQNKEQDLLLMDIPRNQQSKTRDGIQILSVYSDLGSLIIGKKEGDILEFINRKQRVKIAKVY